MNFLEQDGERLDDLQLLRKDGNKLTVIQNPNRFCFGTDAVLLANFARIPNGAQVADLGTGCGVIPLILSVKTNPTRIVGVELQPDVAQMAERSVKLNHLEGLIEIVTADLKHLPYRSCFDVVTCNPPYYQTGSGKQSQNLALAIARTELTCTLDDVTASAAQLLNPNGNLFIVHRPERLADLFGSMQKHGIQPKRIRTVCKQAGTAPVLVLVQGTKGGKSGLKWEPPLVLYDQTGQHTHEINKIYSN